MVLLRKTSNFIEYIYRTRELLRNISILLPSFLKVKWLILLLILYIKFYSPINQNHY